MYPAVRQSEDLQWSFLDDETLDLRFKDIDSLNPLIADMVGDMSTGLRVPPGAETNRENPGIYMTIRAHLGLGYFQGRKGPTRSVSLTPGTTPAAKQQKAALLAAHVQKFGEPIRKADCVKRADGTPYELAVTPHTTGKPAVLKWKDTKRKGRIPVDRYTGSTYSHPILGQWNKEALKLTLQEYFLTSFSCLAYVWTMSDCDAVGIGLDLPTFSQAEEAFRHWNGDQGKVHRIAGAREAVCWTMAAVMNLPRQPYPYLYKTDGGKVAAGSFLPHAAKVENNQIYQMLRDLLEFSAGAGNDMLRSMKSTPIRTLSPTRNDTLHDVIFNNLRVGLPWFMGVADGMTNDRYRYSPKMKSFVGFNERDRARIQQVGHHLFPDNEEGLMQRIIAAKMKTLYYQLAQHYRKKFGTKQRMWERAKQFAVAVHLNRAHNKAGILAAINAISNEAGGSLRLTGEEFDWLIAALDRNPTEIQQLLILSCDVDFRSPAMRKADDAKREKARLLKEREAGRLCLDCGEDLDSHQNSEAA